MSEVWGPDSGILRKHKSQVVEDLLVFGYSCKLFRDDEKALSIDQGKHLIPWMGDEKVKIDRLTTFFYYFHYDYFYKKI